ncbi:MAG: HD-GYP domain-containing protein [Rhizobacter sp.]|jgi:hypothetical protein
MKLIPFEAEYLQVGTSLPFDLHNTEGLLLMPREAVIADRTQLEHLLGHDLMVDEHQSADWRQERVRERELEDAFAEAFEAPRAPAPPPPSPPDHAELITELGQLQSQLHALLIDNQPDDKWLPRMTAVSARTLDLTRQHADALLFLVLQRAVRRYEHYSSRHALLCAMASALCAEQLDLTDTQIHSLMLAALTMNWSMTAMQDELTLRERTPSLDQRIRIDRHPELSARQLEAAGVQDRLCIDVVARHHQDGPVELRFAALSAADQLARVLRRLDVFFAKISPRLSRPGMPAPLAARAACLGPGGEPDEVGSAIIKVLGIYPPGTCVALANGELAMVLRRGLHASQPQVISLTAAGGAALLAPLRRDTAQPAYRITGTARPGDLRSAVALPDLLAMM